MNNVVTQRFIECIKTLKDTGRIKSARQFAFSLDYFPQGLSEMFNNRRDVTIELLRRAVELYHFNPAFLFTGEGPMFTDGNAGSALKVLTVVTNGSNEERIVHVPVAAQAGYAEQLSDPVFVQELPTYSLPDDNFRFGSYRSFDVAGDSMEPTLQRGDRVVCAFIEPQYWEPAIKDNQVYVVVTHSSVLVKRLINRMRHDKCIDLVSDNRDYSPVPVPVSDIREVWRVRLRISGYLDRPQWVEMTQDLENQIQRQGHLIEKLSKALDNFAVEHKTA